MTRFVLVFILLAAWATPLRAQDDPPFPEYPDFVPGASVMGDQHRYSLLLLDRFEVAPAAGDVPVRLEGFYRVGTDFTRFYLAGEAEGLAAEREGEAEVQALYSRLVTAYFEARAGLRLDVAFGEEDVRTRPHLVLGLEGLAPYWFEVEPAVFVSAAGDVSARFEGSYDLLVTQRLVLQPDAEVNVALQEVEDWGVGSGVNDIEVGLRLRYEIVREVAPYVGVAWANRFGAAADFARAAGEPASETLFVFGIRLWR